MLLTDFNSLPISRKTGQPTCACAVEVKCDLCTNQYTSSWNNRQLGMLKYSNDLCRSCKQKNQYNQGVRELQRTLLSNRNKKLIGLSWEELYGANVATEIKSKLSKKISGDFNPRWGTIHNTKEEIEKQKKLAAIQMKTRLSGKSWEELYGKKKAKELKISASLKSSGPNNPMFGKPSPKGGGGGWSGQYGIFYFRSLLELSYLIFLIEHDIFFECGELKKFGIKYTFEGKNKTYFPDFYLTESNTIVEVKPKSLVSSRLNTAKFNAARLNFENFVVITDDDIDKITSDQLKTLVDSGSIILDESSRKKYEQLKH